ncbi:hypothetical protein QR98_0052740 [Sarcoptes scabiei]|uniref:Nuclear receptor coactivator 6 TRADD-N domain-containing protein n=1 Tax=Sarcoptes scabiei TaxID=52283 RepID=A0A132A836_SARSC|nr:hypothetical protein QR98_0052740 [Sarcoptes scabiei]
MKLSKVEPWNSVRVTLNLSADAAQYLMQLAERGDSNLRELGILSVQLDGQQVISLLLPEQNESHGNNIQRNLDDTIPTDDEINDVKQPELKEALRPTAKNINSNVVVKTENDQIEATNELLHLTTSSEKNPSQQSCLDTWFVQNPHEIINTKENVPIGSHEIKTSVDAKDLFQSQNHHKELISSNFTQSTASNINENSQNGVDSMKNNASSNTSTVQNYQSLSNTVKQAINPYNQRNSCPNQSVNQSTNMITSNFSGQQPIYHQTNIQRFHSQSKKLDSNQISNQNFKFAISIDDPQPESVSNASSQIVPATDYPNHIQQSQTQQHLIQRSSTNTAVYRIDSSSLGHPISNKQKPKQSESLVATVSNVTSSQLTSNNSSDILGLSTDAVDDDLLASVAATGTDPNNFTDLKDLNLTSVLEEIETTSSSIPSNSSIDTNASTDVNLHMPSLASQSSQININGQEPNLKIVAFANPNNVVADQMNQRLSYIMARKPVDSQNLNTSVSQSIHSETQASPVLETINDHPINSDNCKQSDSNVSYSINQSQKNLFQNNNQSQHLPSPQQQVSIQSISNPRHVILQARTQQTWRSSMSQSMHPQLPNTPTSVIDNSLKMTDLKTVNQSTQPARLVAVGSNNINANNIASVIRTPMLFQQQPQHGQTVAQELSKSQIFLRPSVSHFSIAQQQLPCNTSSSNTENAAAKSSPLLVNLLQSDQSIVQSNSQKSTISPHFINSQQIRLIAPNNLAQKDGAHQSIVPQVMMVRFSANSGVAKQFNPINVIAQNNNQNVNVSSSSMDQSKTASKMTEISKNEKPKKPRKRRTKAGVAENLANQNSTIEKVNTDGAVQNTQASNDLGDASTLTQNLDHQNRNLLTNSGSTLLSIPSNSQAQSISFQQPSSMIQSNHQLSVGSKIFNQNKSRVPPVVMIASNSGGDSTPSSTPTSMVSSSTSTFFIANVSGCSFTTNSSSLTSTATATASGVQLSGNRRQVFLATKSNSFPVSSALSALSGARLTSSPSLSSSPALVSSPIKLIAQTPSSSILSPSHELRTISAPGLLQQQHNVQSQQSQILVSNQQGKSSPSSRMTSPVHTQPISMQANIQFTNNNSKQSATINNQLLGNININANSKSSDQSNLTSNQPIQSANISANKPPNVGPISQQPSSSQTCQPNFQNQQLPPNRTVFKAFQIPVSSSNNLLLTKLSQPPSPLFGKPSGQPSHLIVNNPSGTRFQIRPPTNSLNLIAKPILSGDNDSSFINPIVSETSVDKSQNQFSSFSDNEQSSKNNNKILDSNQSVKDQQTTMKDVQENIPATSIQFKSSTLADMLGGDSNKIESDFIGEDLVKSPPVSPSYFLAPVSAFDANRNEDKTPSNIVKVEEKPEENSSNPIIKQEITKNQEINVSQVINSAITTSTADSVSKTVTSDTLSSSNVVKTGTLKSQTQESSSSFFVFKRNYSQDLPDNILDDDEEDDSDNDDFGFYSRSSHFLSGSIGSIGGNSASNRGESTKSSTVCMENTESAESLQHQKDDHDKNVDKNSASVKNIKESVRNESLENSDSSFSNVCQTTLDQNSEEKVETNEEKILLNDSNSDNIGADKNDSNNSQIIKNISPVTSISYPISVTISDSKEPVLDIQKNFPDETRKSITIDLNQQINPSLTNRLPQINFLSSNNRQLEFPKTDSSKESNDLSMIDQKNENLSSNDAKLNVPSATSDSISKIGNPTPTSSNIDKNFADASSKTSSANPIFPNQKLKVVCLANNKYIPIASNSLNSSRQHYGQLVLVKSMMLNDSNTLVTPSPSGQSSAPPIFIPKLTNVPSSQSSSNVQMKPSSQIVVSDQILVANQNSAEESHSTSINSGNQIAQTLKVAQSHESGVDVLNESNKESADMTEIESKNQKNLISNNSPQKCLNDGPSSQLISKSSIILLKNDENTAEPAKPSNFGVANTLCETYTESAASRPISNDPVATSTTDKSSTLSSNKPIPKTVHILMSSNDSTNMMIFKPDNSFSTAKIIKDQISTNVSGDVHVESRCQNLVAKTIGNVPGNVQETNSSQQQQVFGIKSSNLVTATKTLPSILRKRKNDNSMQIIQGNQLQQVLMNSETIEPLADSLQASQNTVKMPKFTSLLSSSSEDASLTPKTKKRSRKSKVTTIQAPSSQEISNTSPEKTSSVDFSNAAISFDDNSAMLVEKSDIKINIPDQSSNNDSQILNNPESCEFTKPVAKRAPRNRSSVESSNSNADEIEAKKTSNLSTSRQTRSNRNRKRHDSDTLNLENEVNNKEQPNLSPLPKIVNFSTIITEHSNTSKSGTILTNRSIISSELEIAREEIDHSSFIDSGVQINQSLSNSGVINSNSSPCVKRSRKSLRNSNPADSSLSPSSSSPSPTSSLTSKRRRLTRDSPAENFPHPFLFFSMHTE